MKNVYLAGPMTGYVQFNFNNFDKYKAKLEKDNGFIVFSPADHDRELLGKSKSWMPKESDSEGPWKKWAIPNSPTLSQMLGDDLNFICRKAQAIAMMPGWEKSAGARAEHATAVALGLEIIYLD